MNKISALKEAILIIEEYMHEGYDMDEEDMDRYKKLVVVLKELETDLIHGHM